MNVDGETDNSGENGGGCSNEVPKSSRAVKNEKKKVVFNKLKAGEFVTKRPQKSHSPAWNSFLLVQDKDGKDQGFAQCKHCGVLLSYESQKTGVSHLLRHKCNGNSALKTTIVIPMEYKKDVIQKCVDFCAKDLRSFETVAGIGFLGLAHELIKVGSRIGNVPAQDLLPHPTTISRNMEEAANVYREKILPEIKDALEHCRCAMTTDMWTDDYRKYSYTTVTVHYITADWTLKSAVLFTSKFPEESKTGENILAELIRQFGKYGIRREDLRKAIFVTDQGANIVKALAVYIRLNCSLHLSNTVLRDTFHPKFLEDELPNTSDLLNSCKSLVTFMKQSGLCSRLSKTLEQCNDTRWNTKETMLESIDSQYDEIQIILEGRGEEHRLDGIDIRAVRDLIALLKPFKEATKEMEAEHRPTLYLVLVWQRHLLENLQPQLRDSREIRILRSRALSSMEKKFIIDDLHMLATFFCPPFRALRMLSNDERASTMLKVRKLLAESTVDFSTSQEVEEEEHSASQPKMARFHQWTDNESIEEISDEVDRYLSMRVKAGDDVLEWWKEHESRLPRLAKVARQVLCIPASSAASERNFSSAGFVISERRSQLSPENLDSILVMHNASFKETSQ